MKLYIILLLVILPFALLAQNAKLKGVVRDAQNNEPLPFTNIVVKGTNIGAITDLDGKFLITGLKPGYISLQVSFVGYKTKITEQILVNNTQVKFIDLTLSADDNVLEGVSVRPDAFVEIEEAPISMQSISTKEIESNPGSNRDISRVIQSFPGVGSTPAFRNDVIIRGGGPSENRFYLDGVEIPVLNHFSTQGASGGPVGIINADFVRNVDFYSAAFPANKSNALSGVLDFKLKDGNIDKMNLQFAVGASEAAFTVDGPIGENTNYIFSVRRSYLQFLFQAIGLPFLPTFNDFQLRVKTNIDSKNQLTFIGLGSLDKLVLNNGIENPTPSQEYILSSIPVNNQWSYTFGAVYKHFFDNGFHTIVLSRNMLNNQLYKYPDNDESLTKSLDYESFEAENKLRYEYNIRTKGYKIVLSANTEFANYGNETSQQFFIEDSLINLQYNTGLDIFKYGLSAQVSKKYLQDKLLVSLGVRADGNSYNSNTSNILNQLSPRISGAYSLSQSTKLTAGAGRYFQQASYTTLGFKNNMGEFVNQNSAKYIGLNQYNIGISHKFMDKVLLSLEGFYKDYFQYPIDMVTGSSLANQGADYAVYGASPVEFTGKGKAVGFEVFNRWNYDSFSLLASYTYVRSLFTDINDDFIPSSWDSQHLLTFTASKELKKNWRVGGKWRYVGGLPYTPYDMSQSSDIDAWNTNGGPTLNYTQLNGNRFNPFHQLDLRVDKTWFFDKWSLMLYIDIQNVYNFQSESQDIVVRTKNTDGSYQTTNNGQDYVLETFENTSGTVLPTIGIMVKL